MSNSEAAREGSLTELDTSFAVAHATDGTKESLQQLLLDSSHASQPPDNKGPLDMVQ